MFDSKHPYSLPPLPPLLKLADVPELFLRLHNEALQQISRLNGALGEIKAPELFLSTFYLQESINSNAVENIQTTIESALEDETRPEAERRPENKEVINYRTALLAGIESLAQFGLSTRTIKSVHQELKIKKGVPGEFRRLQNSIANVQSDGTREILYTPPPALEVNNLIANWEKFVMEDMSFFPLIKAAIAHYQFEAIHPFEDGNGRTGRILIVLQLIQDQLLDHPALFISAYLNQNQDRYKKLLLSVTTSNDWWAFIGFMLTGFAGQAIKTRMALTRIREARREIRELLYKQDPKIIKQSNIPSVVDHIFYYPTTHPKFMERETGIHWQTCSKYLKALATKRILYEDAQGKYKFFRNQKALDALVARE